MWKGDLGRIIEAVGRLSAPYRTLRLMSETNKRFGLDLTGLTVLTEAASGPYLVTPVLAALAGARVFAFTSDSSYASSADVCAAVEAFAEVADVRERVILVSEKDAELLGQADIITNLGLLRPIDAKTVSWMKPTAVVPLMWEAWEARPGEIDFEACREKGIVVVATNEEAPSLRMFHFLGLLVAKILFQNACEIRGNQLMLYGGIRFGPTIAKVLRALGARVIEVSELDGGRHLGTPGVREEIRRTDALILAKHEEVRVVIGEPGEISPSEIAKLNPDLVIVHLSGSCRIDRNSLSGLGIHVVPLIDRGPHFMNATLAELGPAPVVSLHAAGLAVGATAARARMRGLSPVEAAAEAARNAPGQLVPAAMPRVFKGTHA